MLEAVVLIAIGVSLVLALYISDRIIERIVRVFVPARHDPGQQGTHQLPPGPHP